MSAHTSNFGARIAQAIRNRHMSASYPAAALPSAADLDAVEQEKDLSIQTKNQESSEMAKENGNGEPKKVDAKTKKQAEDYLFALGHGRKAAEKHAARIGHEKVVAAQQDGVNPLAADEADEEND